MPNDLDPTSRQILDLVASHQAPSRSTIATALQLAPSTVGTRVQSLIDAGVVREVGEGASHGGRRPRVLRLADDGGTVLTAAIGWHHVRVGTHRLNGTLTHVTESKIEIADGPEAVLRTVTDMLDAYADTSQTRAIGLALRGPVSVDATGDGALEAPLWPGIEVDQRLAARYEVPVAVDNDANFAALGEHLQQFGQANHSVTVLAGSAIGSGIVIGGEIYKGATGVEGDIGHTRVESGLGIPCTCGNTGCLETVASGEAIARQLNDRGYDDVGGTDDALRLIREANPDATTLLRAAGTQLGMVLCSIVNFFNPHAVFLAGELTDFEPFIAAVRSSIYDGCLPLATRSLRIEQARSGADAVLLGAARAAGRQLSFAH